MAWRRMTLRNRRQRPRNYGGGSTGRHRLPVASQPQDLVGQLRGSIDQSLRPAGLELAA